MNADTNSFTRVLRMVAVASRTGLYGGPFDTARRQAETVSKTGIKCTLAGGHFPDDEPLNDSVLIAENYYPVRRVLQSHGFSLVFSLKALRNLYLDVKDHDVVHVSFAREILPLSTSVFCLFLRRRLIVQPHGMLTSKITLLHRIVDIPVRIIFRRAHKVVALTDKERYELLQWDPGYKREIVVLGNPVPNDIVPKQRGLPAIPRVSFIARLHPRKRVSVFIDAARILADQSSVHFVVIGPDGGDQEVVRMAERTVPNFSYHGAVPSHQVTQELDITDVFVLPSSNEPWGNVLATSLALGIPVIVSRSTALTPAIEKYGAGLVFEDDDSVALADCIRCLTSDGDLYTRVSQGALQLAEDMLSEEQQRHGLLNLYMR